MTFFQSLSTDPIVHSIGWTLLHACWQITLIAFALKLVIKPLEKYSASLAHSLSILSLLAICIWSTYTFVNEYNHFDQVDKTLTFSTQQGLDKQILALTKPKELTTVFTTSHSPNSWRSRLLQLEYYLPIFVLFWLMGTAFLIFRFIAGWIHLRHLKTRGLSRIDAAWLENLDQLKQKIGVQKNVSFLFSSLVKEPITIGHFKPIILVPLGIFSSLSPEMVETILLHELAHIKRSDYLINIIQSLLEIIFFFHPALWWISNKIRQTREHACDDLAVNVCQDPMLYAKTLTQIQFSYLSTKNHLVMSATGKNGNFTTRIKRLFGYTEPTVNSKKNVVFSSLIFIGLIAFAFTPSFEQSVNSPQLTDDTTSSSVTTYAITPATTQKQLDFISTALKKENITAIFSNVVFNSDGGLEQVKCNFKTANFDTYVEFKKIVNIILTLDPSKSEPLEIKFETQGSATFHTSEKDIVEEASQPSFPTLTEALKKTAEPLQKTTQEVSFFKKTKATPSTQHTFKVLHKAEIRKLNKAPGIMGVDDNGITISSDNCDKENKAFHVFNDQILSVPDGFCYPPTISRLTEVDSFFIVDADLATQLYGQQGYQGAYVYYYKMTEKTKEVKTETSIAIEAVDHEIRPAATNHLLQESFKISPNPIRQNTSISFTLSDESTVKLSVTDSNGRRLSIIADEKMSKGEHRLNWEPKNLPNGIYHINIQTNQESHTQSVILQQMK